MPTNSKRIALYERQLLSRTGMKARFMDYLDDKVDESLSAAFQSSSGVLDGDVIGISPSGNDEFDLDLTSANRVVVGSGEIIDLTQISGAGITVDVPFENDAGTTYYVGARYAQVERDIETNPRTGEPEYASLLDTYGEVDNPSGFLNTPSTNLRIYINTITESGVDHSGRTCRVWLVDPVSHDDSVAFFEGTVGYAAPDNYVDIPYSGSAGPLGQDTSFNPPSTTVSDYKVFIEGVSVTTVNIISDNTYAFLGTIAGNGPGSPPPAGVTTLQNSIFIISLDKAYDGPAGTGSGRKVLSDVGAVELISAGGTTDQQNATFRLNRLGDTTGASQFMLQMITGGAGGEESIPLAVLAAKSNGVELLEGEAADQTGTQTLDFSRGGCDLGLSSLRLSSGMHMVLVSGTAGGSEDGLYYISSITGGAGTSELDVVDIKTGAAPSSWGVAVGTSATILQPILWLSGTDSIHPSLVSGFSHIGTDGQGNGSSFKMLPEGVTGSYVEMYNNDQPPTPVFRYIPGNNQTNNVQSFHFEEALLVDTPAIGGDGTDGVRITGGGGDSGAANPHLALAIGPAAGPLKTGFAQDGMLVKGHQFRDDFFYSPTQLSLAGPHTISTKTTDLPHHYRGGIVGSGTIAAVDGAQAKGHGCLSLLTGTNTNDECRLEGPESLNVSSTLGFQWVFHATFRPLDTVDIETRIGLTTVGGTFYAYFEFDTATSANWLFIYDDGGGLTSVDTGVAAVLNKLHYFRIDHQGSSGWIWRVDGTSSIEATASWAADTGLMQPFAYVRNLNNLDAKEVYLDMWEFQDTGEALWGVHGSHF